MEQYGFNILDYNFWKSTMNCMLKENEGKLIEPTQSIRTQSIQSTDTASIAGVKQQEHKLML